jgi:hypothetical protein
MKKLLLLIISFSYNSYSQKMDPIIMYSSNINVIGGLPIIFNTSSSILGLDYFRNSLGLNEISKVDNGLIFPNPSNDFINLNEISEINLYDQTGKLIESKTTKKVDISSYNSGIYFISILSSNNNKPIKFIKL